MVTLILEDGSGELQDRQVRGPARRQLPHQARLRPADTSVHHTTRLEAHTYSMEVQPVTVNIDDSEGIRDLPGRDLGPSDWLTMTQGRVDTFADAANDRHWVHNDPVPAARGPFGSSIAHAHLTLSLIPWFSRQLLVFDDGEASLFYGYNRVRFPAPVPSDSRLRM